MRNTAMKAIFCFLLKEEELFNFQISIQTIVSIKSLFCLQWKTGELKQNDESSYYIIIESNLQKSGNNTNLEASLPEMNNTGNVVVYGIAGTWLRLSYKQFNNVVIYWAMVVVQLVEQSLATPKIRGLNIDCI